MQAWLLSNLGSTLTSVGLILTAVGWLVSSRLQRRTFVYTVTNAARGEIVEALNRQQDALRSIEMLLRRSDLDIRLNPSLKTWQMYWDDMFATFERRSTKDLFDWIFKLEEFETLFPEVRLVRIALVERQQPWIPEIQILFADLHDASKRPAAMVKIDDALTKIGDFSAFSMDLQGHIQNLTLGRAFGRRVPPRQPGDPSRPRIVARRRWQHGFRQRLEIVPTKSSADPPGSS